MKMDSDKIMFGIIGVVTVVIFGFIISSSFKSNPSNVNAQTVIGENTNRKGAENPVVTIVEFSDYECPFCAEADPVLNDIIARYSNDVALVYRHFPLPGHAGALPAAKASEAAAEQGKFWEYHAELFSNSPNFSFDELKQYAEDLGLDTQKFESDFNSQPVIDRVKLDESLARSLNVGGTPTFYMVYDDKFERLELNSFDDIEAKVVEILNSKGIQSGTGENNQNVGSTSPSDTQEVEITIDESDLNEDGNIEINLNDELNATE